MHNKKQITICARVYSKTCKAKIIFNFLFFVRGATDTISILYKTHKTEYVNFKAEQNQ